MTIQMEVRFSATQVESTENGDSLIVVGYANKTNQLSEVLGKRKKFREKIMPGTFTRAIEKSGNDIHFLLSHDNEKILASTRNGSLVLEEDANGLRIEARISPTTYGKDAYQLVQDGILVNMSFGMVVNKDEWQATQVPGLYERTITDLTLYEVSIVRDPAYSQTVISARGIDVVEDAVPEEFMKEEERMNEEMKEIVTSAIDAITSLGVDIRSALDVIKENQEKEIEDRKKDTKDEDKKDPEAKDEKDPENKDKKDPKKPEKKDDEKDPEEDQDDDEDDEDKGKRSAKEIEAEQRSKEFRDRIKKIKGEA